MMTFSVRYEVSTRDIAGASGHMYIEAPGRESARAAALWLISKALESATVTSTSVRAVAGARKVDAVVTLSGAVLYGVALADCGGMDNCPITLVGRSCAYHGAP